ncbi:MAG: nickel pincer cofactor biosynthesis protein LarC [Pseudomonadota bacterium]
MKTAYLDCFSGISGDMFVGALLDSGLPFQELTKALSTLPLQGYSLDMKREERCSLSGTRFIVRVEKEAQHERTLPEIETLIKACRLSKRIKEKSLEIFRAIALEESKIHNRPLERIHFHEIGAVDSIIDILGAVFGVEFMGIGPLFASSIPLGSGFVDTRHGRIPLPAPATLALLSGMPVHDSGLKEELVTPTGAALLKCLVRSFGIMPPMEIDRVGYGVGTMALPDRPNLLRIITGREPSEARIDTVIVMEANLDDSNPEWLGFLMERLLGAGALDVNFCPIQMKKNRPGILIQIIGRPHQQDALMDILFQESTTLGIRFGYSQRKTLDRSHVTIESPWGKMKVKKIQGPGGASHYLPEYETCRKIAEKKGLPLKEIYFWVTSLNRP